MIKIESVQLELNGCLFNYSIYDLKVVDSCRFSTELSKRTETNYFGGLPTCANRKQFETHFKFITVANEGAFSHQPHNLKFNKSRYSKFELNHASRPPRQCGLGF